MRVLHSKHKYNHRDIIKSKGKDAFKVKRNKGIKKDEIIQKIVNKLNISEDVINGAEIISLVGKRNLVVENYVKVVEYSEELIVIKTKKNYLHISGKGLKIEYLLDVELRITGKIESISFEINN